MSVKTRALVNVIYKILSYYILDGIKPLTEGIIGDYSSDFKINRSMIDQILTLNSMYSLWILKKEMNI